MKKIFGTLALALCLTAMVSCGGDEKSSVKAKAEYFIEKAQKISDDDYAAQEAWFEEVGKYAESLSEADQEKFAGYIEAAME